MRVIKKIKRSRSVIKVLKDANGDTYYSKSFKSFIFLNIFKIKRNKKIKDRLKSHFLNDFASIQFMSQLSELSEYVPHFCSGKKEFPSFIMSDVGPGQQLDEILLGRNYALAEEGLISLMKTLATIHKETIGKESQFLTIRESLGKCFVKGGGNKRILDFMNFLERISTYLGIDFVSQNIEKELREIIHAVFEPQRLFGLTHWDPCPDNCMLVEGTVKIYDFERARYSNVLIDGLFLSTRFPSCWCFADIPQAIIDKAEKEYRNILSQKVPEINDDSYFMKQKTIIMTFWLLESISFDLEKSLKKDVLWGIATKRQRILLRFELTTKILKEQKIFPKILQLFDKLSSELSRRWGVDVIKVKMYNAFLENK